MERDTKENQGRVTGLGGIFVKSGNRETLVQWYRDVLGFPYDGYGANFIFRDDKNPDVRGYNVWGPFKDDTDYFEPSSRDFMINLRVDDLDALLVKLEAQGVRQVKAREDHEYGKFAWIIDPEGTKIELWEQVGDVPIADNDNDA